MSDKVEEKSYGFKFIKKTDPDHPGKVLMEIWQDVGDNNKPITNSWKLISSEWLKEPEYKKPIWVDNYEEYRKIKEENPKANVHVKSKPSTGPVFINEKGEICQRHFDEYDHCYTIRCDNPNNLTAEEATEVMRDLANIGKDDKDKEENVD